MLLYYITDRMQFPGDEAVRQRRLLEKIAEAARCGVNYIQLREKDLSSHDLELLAREAMRVVREISPATDNRKLATRLLINSRTDIALAAGLDGVHLRSQDISPSTVCEIWEKSAWGQPPLRQAQGRLTAVQSKAPLIGVSCHSISEVAAAAKEHADFVVLAPVFEKKDAPSVPATGLETLRQACQQDVPVLALGGIKLENAQACLEAGAAGIAGIHLFQENNIAEVVRKLRG